jgi:hypothetical protein
MLEANKRFLFRLILHNTESASEIRSAKILMMFWQISNCDINFFHSLSLSDFELEIYKIQKSLKFCCKILKTANAKKQNYEIDQNWMKLLFTIT